MNKSEILHHKIKKLKQLDKPEFLRFDLYSILTIILLSKKEFKSNNHISGFLGRLDITFKDYVFKSRTLILARVLRIIEKADDEVLVRYKKIIIEIYSAKTEDESIKDTPAKKEPKKDSYFSDVLKKYSRSKK